MLKCSKCGADTVIVIDDVPICVECDRKSANEPKIPGEEPKAPERKPPTRSDRKTELRCPTCGGTLAEPRKC